MEYYVYSPKRKKSNASRYLKLYGVLFLFLGLLAGGIWYIQKNEFFKIKTFEVKGVEGEMKAEILASIEGAIKPSLLRSILTPSNYFFWPNATDFNSPEFRRITIEKKLFSRNIIITVEPREQFGIWCNISECYWFDREGIVINTAPLSEGELVIRINDDNETKLELGKPVLPEKEFEAFLGILRGLEELKLSIKSMKVIHSLEELQVTTKEGAAIHFGLGVPATSDLFESLKALIKKNPLRTVDYIDLTVENKAYLKVKE